MKKRIILLNNVIIAYILFPIIYIHEYWINIITGNYKMYDIYRDSLGDYLSLILEGASLFATIFLFINLLPFQILKSKWLYKYSNKFYIKSLGYYFLFNILFILLTGWGGYFLLPSSPWLFGLPFILVLLVFSIIFQTALYLTIDRKILKSQVM